jgi:hypothetical protein
MKEPEIKSCLASLHKLYKSIENHLAFVFPKLLRNLYCICTPQRITSPPNTFSSLTNYDAGYSYKVFGLKGSETKLPISNSASHSDRVGNDKCMTAASNGCIGNRAWRIFGVEKIEEV